MYRCLAHLLLALLTVGGPACSKRESARPDARPAVKVRGLTAGHPQLARAIRDLVRLCQVSSTGHVSRCPDHEDRRFRQLERSLGARAALRTFCHGLGDSDERVRALSGSGLSRLAYRRSVAQARDPELLGCFFDRLRHLPDRRVARPLARATAYMATALDREQELVLLLDRSKQLEVREAGYGALWEAGRSRVLASLGRLIKDPGAPISVRTAAIDGLTHGDALRPAERQRVCSLLEPLLTARELPLAGAAARASAISCPAQTDRVLEAAEARLEQGQLEPAFVSAIRAVENTAPGDISDAQRPRILALLTRIVDDGRLGDATRAAALSKLSWIDRRRALKLARRQLPAAGGALRQAAEQLVGDAGR